MRIALLAVTALLFAGCLSSPTTPTQGTPSSKAVHLLPPAAIHQTGNVMAQTDPENLAMQPTCSQPTSMCVHVKFTSNTTANVTATLKWMQVGDDFDLYLYQGGTLVSMDGINNLGSTNPNDYTATTQVMHATVKAGDYEFLIVPFLVAKDAWTLDAKFT